MNTNVQLPSWLDNLIFDQLGAKYCRSNADMTVIDWDKSDVLNYLGTYFPRSYAESYCIFSDFFKNHKELYAGKKELSVFDFGCGTGGEIIALITVLSQYYQDIKKVRVVALDGNIHALKLYERVLTTFKSKLNMVIENNSAHICIDDFYDLNILNNVLKHKFDIILSFKAICEFVSKQQFEKSNAYEYIVQFMLPKLSNSGIILLVDVTTYNNTSQDWLPEMMDRGLKAAKCIVVKKNEGYNQTFKVSHSHKIIDESKVAWRIITN